MGLFMGCGQEPYVTVFSFFIVASLVMVAPSRRNLCVCHIVLTRIALDRLDYMHALIKIGRHVSDLIRSAGLHA